MSWKTPSDPLPSRRCQPMTEQAPVIPDDLHAVWSALVDLALDTEAPANRAQALVPKAPEGHYKTSLTTAIAQARNVAHVTRTRADAIMAGYRPF